MTSAPPSSAGADQAMDRLPSPGVTVMAAGALGALTVDGVPVSLADQGPFPASLTARTCRSYRSPLVRPSRVYSRAPELQTSSSTVQLTSDLSCTSLRMYRRSYDVTSAPPSSAGADQAMDRLPSPGVTRRDAGAPGTVTGWDGLRGVPVSLADQDPLPTALTALTCTSYRTPPLRLKPVDSFSPYCRRPELQMSSRTVQLSSALSVASLRM